jgi:hypothetical protein
MDHTVLRFKASSNYNILIGRIIESIGINS